MLKLSRFNSVLLILICNFTFAVAAHSAYAEREARLEAQYLELFNTYDPNYLADDATCKTYRYEEKIARSKKQIQTENIQSVMEDSILNLCKRNQWDKFSDNVGHLVDAGANAITLNDFSPVSERAMRWAMTKKSYDILTYKDLDKILSEKCFPGRPQMNILFKRELIKDDIAPSLAGTTGGLIVGWYILKGAGKLIFTPAKAVMTAGGATTQTFKKIKTLGYLVAAPIVGLSVYFTVKENKDKHDVAVVTEDAEQLRSRISLEATFPEPEVKLAAEECLEAQQNITDAPTAELAQFWTRSMNAKCEMFKRRAEYALSSLQTDDFNRCHPGNRGAAERIEALVTDIAN